MAGHLPGLVFLLIRAVEWLRFFAPLLVVLVIFVVCFQSMRGRSKR